MDTNKQAREREMALTGTKEAARRLIIARIRAGEIALDREIDPRPFAKRIYLRWHYHPPISIYCRNDATKAEVLEWVRVHRPEYFTRAILRKGGRRKCKREQETPIKRAEFTP